MQSKRIPLAYLITFRTYATWLHGDSRGSVDRHHNRYASPLIRPSQEWHRYKRQLLKQTPVSLTRRQRRCVRAAIRDACSKRAWSIWTLNVRTNHVHVVVSANCDPEIVTTAFKAKATRKMREKKCWRSAVTPWARRGSKKYLWTERDVIAAVCYVEYDQGLSID